MKFLKCMLCMSLLTVSSVYAGDAEIKKNFKNAMPSLTLKSIEKSKVAGLYQVEAGSGEMLFTSADGAYFITGDLYSTLGGKLKNLTEKRREQARVDDISAIDDKDKIIFAPKGETKAKITVFTDIDCGYCRKLHKEVPALNDMGVEVSYLAFPRSGIGSDSYHKFVSAWCSDDKKTALTTAKAGQQIPEKNCKNPIAEQYDLGRKLGVNGTPAIVLEDGRIIPGYMPAAKLGKALGVL